MSIDWGIALGAAVKSGVNTYTTLQDQAAKDLQMQRVKRQMDDEDGFRRAQSEAAREQYTGGEAVSGVVDRGLNFTEDQKAQLKADFAKMPVDQQQTALRAYANAGYANEGQDLSKIGVYRGANGEILATNQVKEYTPVQRQGLVLDRMMKEGNLYGVERSLQLKQMLRENELKDRFDKFSSKFQDEMAEVQGVIQGKGLSGVPDAVNGKLKAHGMQAEYVPGKAGGMVVVKQGKNVVGQYTNPDDVMTGIANAQLSLFSQELLPLFGDIGQVTQFLNLQFNARAKEKELALKGRELDIKDREVGIKASEASGKNAYYQALTGEVGKGTPVALVNPATQEMAFADPKRPGSIVGLDGQPITDTKGFVPVALAQTKMTTDATANKAQYGTPVLKNVTYMDGGTKRSISVIQSFNRDETGKPVVQVTTLDGSPITDSKILGQLTGQTSEDPDRDAALAGARKRLSEGTITPAQFNKELEDINRYIGPTSTERALAGADGKGGVLDGVFGPKKSESAPSPQKSALPSSAIPVDKELPASDRLKQATIADSKAGGSYHFTQLANEAKDKVTLIEEQLKNLDVSIPKMPAEARKPLEDRKKQLKADLKVYKSILDQQKARTGLN